MQITGKHFVVTGGGNGIGREVVLELLRRGAKVSALDLSEAGLEQTALLAAAGRRLSTHVIDITDRAAVEALPKAVLKAHGEVDGVANVAGIIQPFVKVPQLDYAAIERVMNVNFWGVIHIIKTFLPLLLERPEASLVNISSMGALAPVPGQAVYGASKAAVKLLTEALQAELRGSRVVATVVFPGAVGTNIAGNSGVAAGAAPADGEAAPQYSTTSAADAGAQIVAAIAKGAPRITIGSDARSLDRLARLMPVKVIGIIADRMRSLLGD